MSFTIKAGTVNKRKNSTYVPTNLDHEYEVVLKESCSDYAPVFILQNPTNRFSYNYLEWDGWYYYIDDVIREKNHMITIKCRLDPLASARPYILASTQFVAYDTTANTEVIDTRLSVNSSEIVSVSSYTGSGNFFEDGTILLGVVGTHNTGTFCVTLAQLKAIMEDIFDNYLDNPDALPMPTVSFTTIDDAADTLTKNIISGLRQLIATGKAPDCIKSCIYVTIPSSNFIGTNETIWLGNYNTGVTAKLINPGTRATETHSLTIPWNFTDWRNNSPYSNVYLKLPYVGIIPLSVSEIINSTSLDITTFVDQNGTIAHLVYATSIGGHNILIGRYGGNCASNILIGASGLNPLNVITGGAAIAAGAITAMTNPIVGGTAAISGFLGALQPFSGSAGNAGGGAYMDDPIYSCYVVSHNTNVEPSSVSVFMGTPTMAVKSLSGLSGYVECRNASVSAPFSESTLQEINNYLNGGVYLE